MHCALTQPIVGLCSHEREKKCQQIDSVLNLFPDHPLVCVCICTKCWAPQDGSTPLHISAQHGHKEVVEVLLGNGAQMNVARKVISDQWRGVI